MPGIAIGRRLEIPKNSRKISNGSAANARQKSYFNRVFSINICFSEKQTVLFSGLVPFLKKLPIGYAFCPRFPVYDASMAPEDECPEKWA